LWEEVIDYKQTVVRGGLKYEVNSEGPYTGKIIKYYPNGQKQREEECLNGTSHGKQTRWDESGQKKEEAEWRDGKQHGKTIWWYGTGQKWREYEWRDGKEISCKKWDKNGTPSPDN